MKPRRIGNVVRGVMLLAVLGLVGCNAQSDRDAASADPKPDADQGVEQTAPDVRPDESRPSATPDSAAFDPDGLGTTGEEPRATAIVPKSAVVPKSAIVPKSAPLVVEPSAGDEPLETAPSPIAPQLSTRRMTSSAGEAMQLPSSDPPATAMEPLTTEMKPPTAAAQPAPTVAAPIAPPTDHTLVKVFYGTDRNAITDAELHPLGKVPWEWLTAAAGGLTLLLVLILCFSKRSAALRLMTGMSLIATIALGVCMYQIPRNTKPGTADTSLQYGGGRGTELQMGVCEVSIPKTHKVGQLESPSILSFEFNEDPEKHVVLMGVERREPDAFFDELNARINEDPAKEAFVFVHGYNVSFEKAARRTAQLAHDLRFDGAPIFYSWPSAANALQYTVDENNVVWTVPQLRDFLLGVAQKTDARRVHLIAHSMGNRALTAALARLSTEVKQEELPLFHEILLTAPDIDADVFRRDIAPAIVKTAQRVTLYASSNDNALVASKKVHGYPRAGESGPDIVVLQGIDTIDVSGVDTSLLGHSYYGSSDSVLTDMAQLLHEYKPPDLRDRLKAVPLGTLRYWQFLAEKMGLSSETK